MKNSKSLNNDVMDVLCAQSKPYQPNMNGAVEAANKNEEDFIENDYYV